MYTPGYVCDLCGEKFCEEPHKHNFNIRGSGAYMEYVHHERSCDLCPECECAIQNAIDDRMNMATS